MFYSSLKTGDAPGSMASIVKMRGTEVGQKITELAVEAVGWYGAPFTELRNYDSNVVPVGGGYVDDAAPRYFNQRKTTIYGGLRHQRAGKGEAECPRRPRVDEQLEATRLLDRQARRPGTSQDLVNVDGGAAILVVESPAIR